MGKKKSTSPKPSQTKAPKKRAPPITRDVGVQSKGPRLQRLRAVLLLIKASYTYPPTNCIAAVELHGDVSVTTADATQTTQYIEENKNYDPSVSFTMNRNEVLNTLVNFCDCWLDRGCSKHVRFGFYTPNNYTGENATELTKKRGIEWPSEGMLAYLSTSRLTEPKVLDAAKKAILGEYECQATERAGAASPSNGALTRLSTIQQWNDGKWTEFLNQIEWKFGEEDAETIVPEIVSAIQSHPSYSQQLANKEGQIISLLIDRLDERQAFRDPTQRCLHASEVLLVFKEVESGEVRLPDPTWEQWLKIPPPTDTRNIAGKVTSVCTTGAPNKVARWSRRASASMIEQRNLQDDKQVLSLKYQIYDVCEEKLSAMKVTGEKIDETKLDSIVAALIEAANQRLTQCLQQYHYRLTSPASIEAMVYELIDSCYLSFDGA